MDHLKSATETLTQQKTNGNNTVEANDSEGNSATVGQDGSVDVNSQDGTNVKVGSDGTVSIGN